MKFNRFTIRSAAAVALLISAGISAFAQTIEVKTDHPGNVFKTGEKIVWHLTVTGDGAADISKISYVLKAGQIKEIGKGEVTLQNGSGDLEATMDSPGSVLAFLKATPEGKPAVNGLAGALVSPDQIKPSAPRPADFDEFWKSKVDELHKVPANPTVEAADGGNPKVDYFKITLDNIRGTHIYGQIAKPKKEGKFPAILQVQYAGVYPLQKGWVTGPASNGWLAMNIIAHDLPIDQPKEFYDETLKTRFHGDYTRIGNESRDTSYFLRMYLSCYRAIEYLKTRDDWDGKTIVVTGGSQGGLQTLMIGGLYPGKLTALICEVPAGCDLTGADVQRQPGWPVRYWSDKERTTDPVHETERYYDVVNFAGNIHCPVLMATGLIDQTCPDHGVCVAYNQIKTPKEIVFMENAEHTEKNNHSHLKYYQRSGAWLSAIARGEEPPVGGK